MNTDKAVGQLEFGLTADLGVVGKVVFAQVKKEDTLKSKSVVTREAANAVPATRGVDHDTDDSTPMRSVV